MVELPENSLEEFQEECSEDFLENFLQESLKEINPSKNCGKIRKKNIAGNPERIHEKCLTVPPKKVLKESLKDFLMKVSVPHRFLKFGGGCYALFKC